MKAIDISMDIDNSMWCYKGSWSNTITEISSTNKGDQSTAYKFELFSHTGTYIETSQHKLKNNIILDEYDIDCFICKVKVLIIDNNLDSINLEDVINELRKNSLTLNDGDSLIIANGWGHTKQHETDFISGSPHYSKELVNYLSNIKLNLIGVDTPVIDSNIKAYGAVKQMFERNERLLLLAPLALDIRKVKTGEYFINALPIKVRNVSASLCRPILIEL
ncbi:cyclase family protein [Vibrio fortis]|nr:cyclase family protein [Vibrio fortis]